MHVIERSLRHLRVAGVMSCALVLTAGAALALPPPAPDPSALLSSAERVSSIPGARGSLDFRPLDNAHVMLSAPGDRRYVLTLNRDCVGLRWARHVGVTVSGDTIWAGFDALTADGEACQIREIHLLHSDEAPLESSL
jgi:hypothetical protein